MKEKVGVVGLGYVGGAVHHWFDHFCLDRVELFSYDKYKQIGSVSDVNRADIVFICVPTPYHEDGRGYDDSAIRESLSILTGSKIVVIKSTILPGSTERFQKEFPQHKITFNPEFLVAKTAVEDFLHPQRQILGVTAESKAEAERVLALLPFAPFARIMSATEAETVKYFGNVFLATKVIFANQMYDICEKLGIRYDAVKEGAAADPRIGASHLDVLHDGYRGYGGACLPKDTKALIDFAKSAGVDFGLIKKVDEINCALTGGASRSLVSVIITTFNRPAYLREAMAGALNQDYRNFELIVVDDASGPETRQMVESFRDPRIRYVRNDRNLGSAESLNRGLRAAAGTYVAILDDDDLWLSEGKLSRQVAFLEANPDYVLVGTNVVVVDFETGKEMVRSRASSNDEDIKKNFLLANPIAHSSALYRREAAMQAGGYDVLLERGKDYDLWLKLARKGKVTVLPDYFLKYREVPVGGKARNALAMRAKDAKFKLKVVWRHRREYPHAPRALATELCRLGLFVALMRFPLVARKLASLRDVSAPAR